MINNKKARNADVVFGVLAIVWAAVLGVLFLVVSLAKFLDIFKVLFKDHNWSAIFLSGTILTAVWVFVGIKALLRAERSKKYEAIIGNYPRFKISDIVKKRERGLKEVSSDLTAMCRRGYFSGMKFDLENKELILPPHYDSIEKDKPLPNYGEEAKTVYKELANLPFFALITALINVAVFIAATGNVFLTAVMGIGTFALLFWFFPAAVYFEEVKARIPSVKKPAATKIADLDEALNLIYESEKELVRLLSTIGEPKIKQPLKEILRVLDEISAYVTDNPAKVKGLRQFVNYYLPTTVNFLQTYEELEAKEDKGENINATLRKIEEVTGNLPAVFKKEYDELYSEKAMDVSAEVSVMKSIINENN